MASLRHGNLLRLLAYCNEGNERMLIYAYMPKKSLDNYIFGTAFSSKLIMHVAQSIILEKI